MSTGGKFNGTEVILIFKSQISILMSRVRNVHVARKTR